MMVKFERNGQENGKTAYLVKRRIAGMWITTSTIAFDGDGWAVYQQSLSFERGRIDRFATLREAKDEAIKSAY
jgi:hypothetical protein